MSPFLRGLWGANFSTWLIYSAIQIVNYIIYSQIVSPFFALRRGVEIDMHIPLPLITDIRLALGYAAGLSLYSWAAQYEGAWHAHV